ncbi:Ribosomal protein L11 methyltransferase [Labeo rohita]|uniref:Ribosomal protein L11 methyltransferase n=1 Tax=Labeo rohita TaxID=84645 RepID=A0ABQ8M089_LABRO|nr:Ribosomal protein L11 methyltransferase [Labeo rohita]
MNHTTVPRGDALHLLSGVYRKYMDKTLNHFDYSLLVEQVQEKLSENPDDYCNFDSFNRLLFRLGLQQYLINLQLLQISDCCISLLAVTNETLWKSEYSLCWGFLSMSSRKRNCSLC